MNTIASSFKTYLFIVIMIFVSLCAIPNHSYAQSSSGGGQVWCYYLGENKEFAYTSVFIVENSADEQRKSNEFQQWAQANGGYSPSCVTKRNSVSNVEDYIAQWRQNNGIITRLSWQPSGTQRKTASPPSQGALARPNGAVGANAQNPIPNKAALVARNCLKNSTKGRSYFHNTCAFPITIHYCVLNPNNAFTCGKVVSGIVTNGGSDGFKAGEEKAIPIGAGQLDGYKGGFELRYFACRNVPGTSAFLTQADPPKGVCR